jgi:hypothetical protein
MPPIGTGARQTEGLGIVYLGRVYHMLLSLLNDSAIWRGGERLLFLLIVRIRTMSRPGFHAGLGPVLEMEPQMSTRRQHYLRRISNLI